MSEPMPSGASLSGEVEIVRGSAALQLVARVHVRYVARAASEALRARRGALPLVPTEPRD